MEAAQAEAQAPAAETPTIYQIPPDVHVELDAAGWQWTNVRGAMALTGMSRRTVQDWLAKGRVEVRRTPSNRPLIKVASLWKSEEPAAAGA